MTTDLSVASTNDTDLNSLGFDDPACGNAGGGGNVWRR
jgi:hypothetical protein